MGHLIDSWFIDAKSPKEAVSKGLARAEELSFYNGDREVGSDSYDGYFKFFDKKFDNEDEALEFFYRRDCDGVVMVKYPTRSSSRRFNEKVNRYKAKIAQIEAKRLEDFKNRKSKTVGCKKCGNRVDSETALRYRLKCPSCRATLGSDSYDKRIQNYADKIDEARAQFNNDIKETGEYRYYARVNIHI